MDRKFLRILFNFHGKTQCRIKSDAIPSPEITFPKVEKMKETQVWSLFGKITVRFLSSDSLLFPKDGMTKVFPATFMYCHLHVLPPSCTTFMYCHPHVLPPSCTATFMYCHLHVLPPSCTATFMYCHLHVLPPSCTATFMYCHLHALSLSCTATLMYCQCGGKL